MTTQPFPRAVLWRSGAFRLAAFQAAILACLVTVLFGVTWWSVSNYIEAKLEASALDELREISDSLQAAGPSGAAGALSDVNGGEHAGLFDPTGTHLAGDIQVAPRSSGDLRVILSAEDQTQRATRRLHVVESSLPDGRRLYVGVDRESADELRERLGQAFVLATLAGIVVALASGFLASRRYLRRIDEIAAAAAQIVDGQLATRLPEGRRKDEIDRLSAALNATWRRIESLLEGMRQVSTDIAHELRTPLAHLRFRLESARASTDADAASRAVMDRSIADVDHVLNVFGALLRIAQIQTRQRRAGFERLDLSQLVSGLVADYRPVFEDEGRVLGADIAPGIEVVGDRTLLIQLVVNLIENALRHTPRGVPVALRLDIVAGDARLVVKDAGPGIPESERERVLLRLVRLDSSRGSPGAGLGLALVKAIADLHQASLVLSDAGPGLVVTLVLHNAGLTDR